MQATIINRTKQGLAVIHGDFARVVGPDSTDADIPPEAAETFKKGKDIQVLISTGKVRVLIPKDGNPTEESSFAVTEAEGAKVDPESFKKLDWKTAIARVQVMTDLDALEDLFAAEERPRVTTAIAERIRLLSDSKTEVEIGEGAKEVKSKAKGKT